MKSPFPGMDPFLEDHLWPDVHNSLIFVIKELLVPQLPDRYLVQTTLYTSPLVSPWEEVGIMVPDVEVLKRKAEEPVPAYSQGAKLSPVSFSIPERQVRIPRLEIQDRAGNQLITAIEVLSPANKYGQGLSAYQQKKARLQEAGVHILEIDLIRRGNRPLLVDHPGPMPHYLVALYHAIARKTDVWSFQLQDLLPTVPVPLQAGEADLVLVLSEAMRLIYERSRYDRAIDYGALPPAPPFSEDELAWMKVQVGNWKKNRG
ncbi:MAG: DUF4058 family protein [Bacteroidota bacterium]